MPLWRVLLKLAAVAFRLPLGVLGLLTHLMYVLDNARRQRARRARPDQRPVE